MQYQQQLQEGQQQQQQQVPIMTHATQYGTQPAAAGVGLAGTNVAPNPMALLKSWLAPIMRDSRELLVSKLFYLFFFAAFGSLFPLLGVYFKQLGMNALQCGVLMGIRPLIEYLSSPFWAGVAERYRKGKLILLCSLASWLLFTMSFSVVQPPAASCITFNGTSHLLYPPNTREIDPSETEAVHLRPKRAHDHQPRHQHDHLHPSPIWLKPATAGVPNAQNEQSNDPDAWSPSERRVVDSATPATREVHGYTGKPRRSPTDHTKGQPGQSAKASEVSHGGGHFRGGATLAVGRLASRVSGSNGSDQSDLDDLAQTHGASTGARFSAEPFDDVLSSWRPQGDRHTDTRPAAPRRGLTVGAAGERRLLSSDAKRAGSRPPAQHWNHRRPGPPPPPPQGARYTPGRPFGAGGRRRAAQRLQPPNYVIGQSPNTVEYTLNYDAGKHDAYVSPTFSSVVYKQQDVQTAFFLMILLVILGEFFSSPAITLADSVTLSYLADRPDDYGRQRMFGSIGWAVAMLFLGIALDRSTSFPAHPCAKPSDRERNYTVCFVTFSCLMGCAFVVATQFRFEYVDGTDNPEDTPSGAPAAGGGESGVIGKAGVSNGQGRLPVF